MGYLVSSGKSLDSGADTDALIPCAHFSGNEVPASRITKLFDIIDVGGYAHALTSKAVVRTIAAEESLYVR